MESDYQPSISAFYLLTKRGGKKVENENKKISRANFVIVFVAFFRRHRRNSIEIFDNETGKKIVSEEIFIFSFSWVLKKILGSFIL